MGDTAWGPPPSLIPFPTTPWVSTAEIKAAASSRVIHALPSLSTWTAWRTWRRLGSDACGRTLLPPSGSLTLENRVLLEGTCPLDPPPDILSWPRQQQHLPLALLCMVGQLVGGEQLLEGGREESGLRCPDGTSK